MSNEGVRFAGVDTATLTVSQIQQSDEGNYRCTVSNGSGKVTSKVARLRISKFVEMVLLPATFLCCLLMHILVYHALKRQQW